MEIVGITLAAIIIIVVWYNEIKNEKNGK